MYRLSQLIVFLIGVLPVLAQSPHGDKLTIKCAKCHNPEGWTMNYETLKFDHQETSFLLEGAHATTDCVQCHQSMVFDEAPSQCNDCHNDIHNMTVGNDCLRCHTPQSWLVDNIPELHEENGFPLIGSHSNLNCTECHTSDNLMRFDRLGNECMNCHMQDYVATEHPNHQEAGYPTNCVECHDPLGTGWDSQNIIHDFFPLTQGHAIEDCRQCHTTGTYSDASPECVSCHQQDYTNTQDPDHQAIGFSTDCASCHTTKPGWTPATINHDFFPLTLGHDIEDCTQCHTTGNYSDVSPECVSCHQEDYAATTDPNHETSGISTNCAACHTTQPGWTPATINHDFFPLTLGHNIDDCTQCHTTDNYSDVSPECVSCHQTDFNNTTDPDHSASGFSTDCASCHTTNPGWTPATINHDFFPLTLGHDIQDCTQCHTTGNYADADPTCVACHQTDFNNTTDPDHSASGFSTDCASCHTTNPGWTPATINHDFFPLTLGHDIQDCTQCHTTGNYADADPTCVACHQTDYDQTNDPDHAAAHFPTDCVACHTTNPGWTPATFDHDGQYFPIYSGKHQGEWDSCTDCHTDANDYSVFTCLTCHGQSQTDNDHSEVNNYVYDSNACLDCHPDGND